METKFREKDLVWAKMRGYPPWPAKVERKPRGTKAPNNKFYVMFFGSPHKHAWMAGGDLFAYEELLEKYNVPRKGLPEAVSEAEDYRAMVRAHRGNKLVTSNSPAQAGVSPDSTTRKRTPASSERGSTKRVKQGQEEEEEESRDSDKQSTQEQFGCTPVKQEPGAHEDVEPGAHEDVEPGAHEDVEKTCPPEERAPPPKRSGRLLKRLSGKEAENGKRQSVGEAAGEESSVGKKEESTSVPLVDICDLSVNNAAPSLVTVDNPSGLQGTLCSTSGLQGTLCSTSGLQGTLCSTSGLQGTLCSTSGLQGTLCSTSGLQGTLCNTATPSQGLKTAESMSQSVASSPNSCPMKTEKQRASNRRKMQSPAMSHAHTAASTSSPATELLSDALLPPATKKQCVEEGKGGRAPKPSPERRSARPRHVPQRLALGEEPTEEGKADVASIAQEGQCSDGVSTRERRGPTPLLAPPPECSIRLSPVGGRGQGSHKKELQTVKSREVPSHTSPSKGRQPQNETISGDQTVYKEVLKSIPCNLPPSHESLPNSEVHSESAAESQHQLTAAAMRVEEPFKDLCGVASQRDRLYLEGQHHSPCPAKELFVESTLQPALGCKQEEENHLHTQPVENLSAGQSTVALLQIELPTVECSTHQGGDDPLTKQSMGEDVSADQPSEKYSMLPREELSIPFMEQISTKLALDNPLAQVMEEPSTQPIEQISINQALEKPSAQTSEAPSTNDKPTQPVEETSTKQVLVDSVKQSMEHSLPHQGETSIVHPLEGRSASPKQPTLKKSHKHLSGRESLESPSQKQVGGAMEGESVHLPSQEKKSKRRSQKEHTKTPSAKRRTSKSQFQEEHLVGQPGNVVGPKPSLSVPPNGSDNGVKREPQLSFGGGNGLALIPPYLVHLGVTPPACTVEQMESDSMQRVECHLLGDEGVCSVVKDTPPSGDVARVHGLEEKGCAGVGDQSTGVGDQSTGVGDQSTGVGDQSTGAKGLTGEQESVALKQMADSTPMACSPVHAGSVIAQGAGPSVAVCETGGGEEKKKKKKKKKHKHKQRGSVAMCETPCSSLSQLAVQPGWTSVQCLQVYNYNLKAALVIGSPDTKTALAVMMNIRSLKCTAEDLQKVPDLVATLRKVKRYRDSNKIRNRANEVYSELQRLFTQGDSPSQAGSSNAGNSDGEKAMPLDQDRPISWEVIDTNDPAAVKSIKMESEGKPPSPSPRRSQRSSVKNNRVNYSKLLEEDSLDEGDDQLVPMS